MQPNIAVEMSNMVATEQSVSQVRRRYFDNFIRSHPQMTKAHFNDWVVGQYGNLPIDLDKTDDLLLTADYAQLIIGKIADLLPIAESDPVIMIPPVKASSFSSGVAPFFPFKKPVDNRVLVELPPKRPQKRLKSCKVDFSSKHHFDIDFVDDD
jgi:hypothetical protein